MQSLRVIDLTSNQIPYSTKDIQRLAINCQRGAGRNGLDCAGLPPHSCLAFGDQHVVRLDDSRQCTRCAGQLIAVAANCGLVGVFLVALAAYFWMISRHPDALTKWVSTASIVLAHLQTLTIVARLKLQARAGLGRGGVGVGFAFFCRREQGSGGAALGWA
eukprot:7247355-Prymnesium_polylepis.1